MATTEVRRPRVVVGVDGSKNSRAALHWAADYARATGAALRAVIAWHYPTTYGYSPVVSDVDFAADARSELMAAVHDEVTEGVEVETAVIAGRPEQVLLDVAADADLVVVGSRGHGEFVGMLLGSVSNYAVHHAHCPVVVVPAPSDLAGPGR